MTSIPTNEIFAALNTLTDYCHGAARERGFHDSGDALKVALDESFFSPRLRETLETSYTERIGNRLMLIAGEVTEAHEEIRAGREVNETHYTTGGKPEGVPSELADVIIRIFDFAGEYDIDLAEIVQEKLVYNETRAKMHGKKF